MKHPQKVVSVLFIIKICQIMLCSLFSVELCKYLPRLVKLQSFMQATHNTKLTPDANYSQSLYNIVFIHCCFIINLIKIKRSMIFIQGHNTHCFPSGYSFHEFTKNFKWQHTV